MACEDPTWTVPCVWTMPCAPCRFRLSRDARSFDRRVVQLAGVVAVEPGDIAQRPVGHALGHLGVARHLLRPVAEMEPDLVVCGHRLHARRPWQAASLIIAERFGHVRAALRKASGECGPVLDRL